MDAQALLALLSAHSLADPLVSALETPSPASNTKDHSADPLLPIPKAVSRSIRKDCPPDPLFPPPEAASYLGISENTLSVWRCVGRYNIEYIKVGRLVRYRKSALDAFLQRRTRGQVEGI